MPTSKFLYCASPNCSSLQLFDFSNFIIINVNDNRKMKNDNYRSKLARLGFKELDFVVAHPQSKK